MRCSGWRWLRRRGAGHGRRARRTSGSGTGTGTGTKLRFRKEKTTSPFGGSARARRDSAQTAAADVHRGVSRGERRARRAVREARRDGHGNGRRRAGLVRRRVPELADWRVRLARGRGRRRRRVGGARDSGVELGGAAWSCAVGAACRAGRTEEALSLLAEMRDASFMRLWPSCPTQSESADRESRVTDPAIRARIRVGGSRAGRWTRRPRARRRRAPGRRARVRAGDARALRRRPRARGAGCARRHDVRRRLRTGEPAALPRAVQGAPARGGDGGAPGAPQAAAALWRTPCAPPPPRPRRSPRSP